jgi:hypothetical protein
MDKVYLDCETCGLHGVPITLQYAFNDGPIQIHEFWRVPISETKKLIERICECEVIGFNLAFDWFHIQKIYNIFDALGADDAIPKDYIDDLADLEMDARDGLCVKPKSSLDLMLHFRKTELQITMDRSDIRIRRVPTLLAQPLADLLTKKIRLDPLLFAGRKKKFAPIFVVEDFKTSEGEIHPYLSNVVLRFRPSTALKALAAHLLKVKDVMLYTDIEVDKKLRPKEYGYAPFARAVGKRGQWNWAWPDVINHHIDHWAYRKDARLYATKDVEYTRKLHHYAGSPAGGDNDSILACAVASCRWKGYALDLPKLKELIIEYKRRMQAPMSPSMVRDYIGEVMNPIELAIIKGSTAKKVLKEITKWEIQTPDGQKKKHPAADRAQKVLDARAAKKKIEVLEKLHKAGRFHASFKVIGALSGRMSGADGLNAQGIDKTNEVRSCFPLAFDGEVLVGGDMQSFEISIAAAAYKDPKLEELLLTCETCNIVVDIVDGKKKCSKCGGSETKSFHAIFGMGFFPHMTYEDIMATKGLKGGLNIYNPVKNGAFASLYGAQPQKLADTIGVDLDVAVEGYHRFGRTFPKVGEKRKRTENAFSSLFSDERGRIKYRQPEEAVESLLGFKRFFTIENYLIRELYLIAENPPKSWTKLKGRITRSRKGEQSISGALRSAVYGAAFATQNSNVRQAANHEIQSTGSGVTKACQIRVWGFQPAGVHKWLTRPMNIHDEIQSPSDPSIAEEIIAAVKEEVEKFRSLIPLIGIDFGRLSGWAEK